MDRTPPKIEIKFSNNNITKENIKVTLTANEKIQKIEGWEEIEEEKIFSKIYSENIKEQLEVFDKAGNKQIVLIEVDNIDKVNPIVDGIENNAWYNSNKKIIYSDNNKIKKAVYYYNPMQEEYSVEEKNFENGFEFVEEGYYKILVVDEANNITEKYFKIDKKRPTIQLMEVSTNNKESPFIINKKGQANLIIEIKDVHYIKKEMDINKIKINVGNKIITDVKKDIISKTITDSGETIELILNNIQGNGSLNIQLQSDFVFDKADNGNEEIELLSPIVIDNTPPKAVYKEKIMEDGKSLITIKAEEPIKERNGWNMLNEDLGMEKKFPCNTQYKVPIFDLAGNKSEIPIKVTQATEIIFHYMAHNACVGWDEERDSGQKTGETAMKMNPLYKVEGIRFYTSGKKEKDFVNFRTYIHHYWGENKKQECHTTGQIYEYGYNPKQGWKTMLSPLLSINGKQYIQFGGSGLNEEYYEGINIGNPIPLEVAKKCLYGISAINMKLKEENEYSILYQSYVDGVGWLDTQSDGKECMYSYQKPITAFRATIVPISEKATVIAQWNDE